MTKLLGRDSNNNFRGKDDDNWYEETNPFFNEDYFKEFSEYISLDRTKKEADFLEKALTLKRGDKILDLACGSGRHTLELAKRGYILTGIDINKRYLNKAKSDAIKLKLKVKLIKIDMRRVSFKNRFDVVISMFTSFGYFKDEKDDLRVLQNAATSLKNGGGFLLDFFNRERIMRIYQARDWVSYSDGTKVLIERKFDFLTSRNHETRTKIKPNGEVRRTDMVIRFYTLSELIRMCESVGLHFLRAFGSYKGEPLNIDSEQCILVAKKLN